MLTRIASALLAAPVALAAASADWPSWRGPHGNGSAPAGSSAPARWTERNIAWKAELPGKGTSTPIVSDGRLFLTSPSAGEDAVLAFDLDGRKLWETRLGPLSDAKHRTLASSCNASPVTDGTAIYVHFRSGRLCALERDGKIRWNVDLTARFGREQLFWDSGTSPVVVGDTVVLSRLHQGESWVAGFDRKTGELRWRTLRNFETPPENNNGYATPVPFEHEGQPSVLIWGADRLTAHAVSDGRLLWSSAGFNPNGTGYWPAISTPVVYQGLAIVPVGRDDRPGQASLAAVKLGGSGDVTASHRAWDRSDVGVFVTAPAVAQSKVYLLRHRGDVVCLEPATGKTVWTGAFPRTAAPYYASPAIADGILYAAREDGVVFTASVKDKFEVLSENPMGERIIATPVPAAGRLFLRGDKHLFCITP